MITDDEFSVLMIAARGEYMLAIGHWEQPTRHLEAEGLLKKEMLNGGWQYTITDAGRAAIREREQEEDRQLGAIIEKASSMDAAQQSCRNYAEQAAQAIANCARESVKTTGNAEQADAERWVRVILERVKDLLGG